MAVSMNVSGKLGATSTSPDILFKDGKYNIPVAVKGIFGFLILSVQININVLQVPNKVMLQGFTCVSHLL